MDIKDIEVGKTYRFVNEDTSPLGLIEYNGGTARVLLVEPQSETDPYPVFANIAKGVRRFEGINIKPEELEEL